MNRYKESFADTPTSSYEPTTQRLMAFLGDGSDETFRFIRKGTVGSYKEDLSAEYIKKFEDWTKENLKSDFTFKY